MSNLDFEVYILFTLLQITHTTRPDELVLSTDTVLPLLHEDQL